MHCNAGPQTGNRQIHSSEGVQYCDAFIYLYVYVYVYKYICTYVYIYIYIYSFIYSNNFKCGNPATRCIYSSPKTTRGQPDRNIYYHKKTTDDRAEVQRDQNIILPLTGFEPVAYGHMRCAQLRAAWMNFFANLNPFCKQKSRHNLYKKKISLFYAGLLKII